MRVGARARTAAVVLLLLPALVLAAEPGWDEYSAGVAHVRAGRFDQGRQSLLAALAAKPDEGRFKVGVKFYDYYPSHYLAEAFLGLGDVEQAKRYLRAAEGVKKVTSDETAALRQLRSRVDAAGGKAPAPPVAPVAVAAGPTGDQAREALAAGDRGRARQLAERVLERDPADEAARQVLDEIGTFVEAAVASGKEAMRAGSLDKARKDLQSVLAVDRANAAARSLIDAVEGQSAQAAKTLTAAEAALGGGQCAEAGRLAVQAARLDTSLAGAASGVERDAKTRCRGTAVPDVAAAAPAPGAEPPVAAVAVVDPPVADVAPPELAKALRRFFAGDVDACIDSLERVVRGGSARSDVLAALATAHATRGFLGAPGEGNADVDRARELFARALGARPGLELDRRYVSPKVVKLLEDARRESR